MFAGVATLVGALLDQVVRDDYKTSTFNRLVSITRIWSRPRSVTFYCLVGIVSLFFTIIVLGLNARFHPPVGSTESDLIGLKSAGPILLAVGVKILFGDYLLALKSFVFLRLIADLWSVFRVAQAKARWSFICASALLIVLDLLLTASLTEWFLNWGEIFQSRHVNGIQAAWTTVFRHFFDSVDLIIKDAIQKSFYVLNGSLVMYGCALVSLATSGVNKYIDARGMKHHIFKTIVGVGVLILVTVSIARDIASR